jgi:hypothetical protein
MKLKKLNTKQKKLLAIGIGVILVLSFIGHAYQYYLWSDMQQKRDSLVEGRNADTQKIQALKRDIEEMNIEISGQGMLHQKSFEENIPISTRAHRVGIYFDNYENETYTKIIYTYYDEEYEVLSLDFEDRLYSGKVQEIKRNGLIYGVPVVVIPFPYEFGGVTSIDPLLEQLKQSPGRYLTYPDRGQTARYEIIQNTNGIKMKKEFSIFPGGIKLQYDFVDEQDKYYSFATSISIVGDDENPQYQDLIQNGFISSTNYTEEFQALDAFIDTIDESAY